MRGKSWHWSKKNGDDEKPWDNVEELPNDPRIGKRVFCLSLLPEIENVWNHPRDHPLFKQE